MTLDLHVHTRVGSCDSTVEYEDLVPWARRAGLDGLCITEHGNRKTGVAEALSREHDFLVLEGIELSIEQGDILIYGVEEIPFALFTLEQVRDHVTAAGGVMFAAHPFRLEITRPVMRHSSPRITFEEALARKVFSLVDGIEVANGWSCQEDVDFSAQVAERLGLSAVGGSDAHKPEQIGSCATVFGDRVRSETEFLERLRAGDFVPQDRRPPDRRGIYG